MAVEQPLELSGAQLTVMNQIAVDLADCVSMVNEVAALHARIQASKFAIVARNLRPHVEQYGPVVRCDAHLCFSAISCRSNHS